MIIKISPDLEKIKSIRKLVNDRIEFVKTVDLEKFSTIIAENYYEIIKELATAILLADGLKSTGENTHKDLIDYLLNYGEFNEENVSIIQDLRIKRNKSSYEGKVISKDYISFKKKKFDRIIGKLDILLDGKLKQPKTF